MTHLRFMCKYLYTGLRFVILSLCVSVSGQCCTVVTDRIRRWHTSPFRLILHERSKRGSWNASQKRVATPTEFSNEAIYKNSRSNLDERFWRLRFGVSSASSDSNAVGGVVNASARNTVQSTFSRLLKRAVQTHV